MFATYLIRAMVLPALLSLSFVFNTMQRGISWLVASHSYFYARDQTVFVQPVSETTFNYANIEEKMSSIFFFINIKINDDFQLNEIYSLNMLCVQNVDRNGKERGGEIKKQCKILFFSGFIGPKRKASVHAIY